jgi:hypothetical protein
MTHISKLLADTTALEAEQIGTAATTAQTNEKIHDNMRALKERIEAGESTGDFIKDVTILLHWFCISKERQQIEAYLRGIQDSLVGKQGQMVLVAQRQEEGTGRHTFGRGWSDKVVTETLTLAVLTDEKLTLRDITAGSTFTQKNQLILPVATHYAVLHNEGSPRKIPQACAESLRITEAENIQAYRPGINTLGIYGYDDHELPKWEIVVGDAEVEAWFQARAEALEPIGNGKEVILLQFERMADIIGKPLDTERYPRLAQYRQRMQILARRKAFLVLAECVKHYTPEEMRTQENNMSYPPAPAQKPAFCAALVAAQDAGAEIADLVSLAKEFGMDIDPTKLQS